MLALTDHNTSKGLAEFMEAGKNSPVITVPGCEFTTEWNRKEIHIVGLFFDEKYWAEVEDYLELVHLAKTTSVTNMIDALKAAGYEIDFDKISQMTKGNVNRAHIAKALMEKGYVKSINEAFSGLLKEGNGFYTPAKRLSTLATIRFIKVFGAAAIMAHPLLNLTYREMQEFLPQAKDSGLDAIETHYTEFDEEMTVMAESLARTYGLKQSGGSDFHGDNKPGINLGKGRGNLFVPTEFYDEVRSCAPFYTMDKE